MDALEFVLFTIEFNSQCIPINKSAEEGIFWGTLFTMKDAKMKPIHPVSFKVFLNDRYGMLRHGVEHCLVVDFKDNLPNKKYLSMGGKRKQQTFTIDFKNIKQIAFFVSNEGGFLSFAGSRSCQVDELPTKFRRVRRCRWWCP